MMGLLARLDAVLHQNDVGRRDDEGDDAADRLDRDSEPAAMRRDRPRFLAVRVSCVRLSMSLLDA